MSFAAAEAVQTNRASCSCTSKAFPERDRPRAAHLRDASRAEVRSPEQTPERFAWLEPTPLQIQTASPTSSVTQQGRTSPKHCQPQLPKRVATSRVQTNDYARWFRHSFLALIVLPHNRRTIESQHGFLSPNAELAPGRCKVLVNFGSCSNSSVLSLIEPILYRCPDQRATASRRA